MRTADIIDRFEQVRRSGAGYIVRCPSHEDKSPSLSIKDGDKGILMYCHAGCRVEDICSRINITMSSLFNGHATRESVSDIDMALREISRKNLAPPPTLGHVMGLAFTGSHDDWFRAYELYPEAMDEPYTEASKMWHVTTMGPVYEYLRSWFESQPWSKRDWHTVKVAAMNKLDTTARNMNQYV